MARLRKLLADDELVVGDKVLVGTTQEPGVVKFKGKTEFSEGEWVGVALDNPLGKNDGTVKDKRYFECTPNHGLFVRKTAIIRVKQGEAAMKPSVKFQPKQKGAAALMKSLRNGEAANIVDKMELDERTPSSGSSAKRAPSTRAPSVSAPVSPAIGHKDKAVDDEQKAAALTELRTAVEDRDMTRIRRAISMASARGVPGSEIEIAQRVLNYENQKFLSNEIGKIRSVIATLAETVSKTQERAAGIERSVKSDQIALGPWVADVVQIVEQRLWTALEKRIDSKIEFAVKKVTEELVKAGVRGVAPTKLKVTKQNQAATQIQARARGKQARQLKGRQGAAATKLQAAWRGKMARVKLDSSSISAAVKLARRRYEAWSAIYDESCAGNSGLDTASFHIALTQIHPKYTTGQTLAIFKGYAAGTERTLIDLPGFCGIAEGCAIDDKLAAEFADINLDTFLTLGKAGAAEAATKVQAAQRAKVERQQMGKRSQAATTLQRFIRKQQANASVSGGSDMSKIVKTARRRYAAWASVFDEIRGEAEELTAETFPLAMGQIFDKMPLGQVNALFGGYCKGRGKSSIDLRGFCAITEAVALGSKAAAEFADLNVETYESLGAAGADAAAVKLQAVERGRQARADASEAREQQAERDKAATKIQAVHRGNTARQEITEEQAERDRAATKIQAVQRGSAARQEIAEQHDAATKIQAVQRGNAARKEVDEQNQPPQAEETPAEQVEI